MLSNIVESGPLSAAQLDVQDQSVTCAASSLLTLSVVSVPGGLWLGAVRDLILDHHNHQILALVLEEKTDYPTGLRIVEWDTICSINRHLIFAEGCAPPHAFRHWLCSELREQRPTEEILFSEMVSLTLRREGQGIPSDLLLDQVSGQVVEYQLSSGLVFDPLSCPHLPLESLNPSSVSTNSVVRDALNWHS